MRSILLAIQYMTIIGLFVETVLILRRRKESLHVYLFLSCIALLVNNLGYLFMMKAKGMEAYFTALKFSYFGRIWVAYLLCLFVLEMSHTALPDIIKNILMAIHAAIYVMVLNVPRSTLFYKVAGFETAGIFPRLIRENGIFHGVFYFLQAIYIVYGLSRLLISAAKERNPFIKSREMMVFMACFVEALFFILNMRGIPGITEYYDLTMLGFFIGTILMLVAISSYDLLGAGEIAKEFLIDRMPEGVIAVNSYGEVQYINEPAKKLFPGLASGKGSVPEALVNAGGTDNSITIDDRIYSLEVNELNRGDNRGRLYVLVDETEHIHYMDLLEEQRDRADRASEAKSRFLANMSHEIRTPINAIMGMDEMILRETKENTIRSYASDILSAGRTLLSLINDILDLSKVEEGKMEIIPVQYELSSLINDLSNMTESRALKKGLKFSVSVNEEIPRILVGDEIRIKQCALNLLSNAVKYTDEGSVTLNVSFEKKDDRNILLCFSVSDTGIGMKKEDMESLFSPYERLDEKRNRNIEGTGLGMSITRQILSLMGSDLKVESEYGKGSTLSFSILQEVIGSDKIGGFSKRLEKLKEEGYSYRELFHAKDARILIVDDTEMNLSVIENLLKRTGIRIDTALSGRDALTLAANNRYDAVLIDHMMPEMDGIETLKRLRATKEGKDIPAVALTANAVSGARKIYMEAGFNDYLSKPVDGKKLERMLKKLLPPEKLTDPSEEPENKDIYGGRERSLILVIDDDETVCAQVKSVMEPSYEVRESVSGTDGVKNALDLRPDIIMLDIHLPDLNGFEVMEKLKDDPALSDIPVLLLTGDGDSETEKNAFKSGASDYVRKPFSPDVLKQRTKRIIDLSHYTRSIEKEVFKQTGRSKRLTREMMMALSKTVDTKDHYTDGHSRRVAAISAEIGRRLGKTDEEQVELYETGLLHDIGKIGVHEDIIQKDSSLTDNEYIEIKEHTVKGYEILKEIQDMPVLREGARWHHEKYGGGGYPDGLKGDEIPETARIVCVADCYDAMTSRRTYSVPKKQDEVRAEIVRCTETWFDPEIAGVLISMIDEDRDFRMNGKAEGKDIWKEYSRLWGDMVSVPAEEGSSANMSLPDWLLKTEKIDTGPGLRNCGSIEGYLSVLGVFHQTGPRKADEIEKLFREGDIEGYTVKVHALKSSARIIGAKELSELAEALEDAGKRGDRTFIGENTEKLVRDYRSLIASLFEEEDKAPGRPEIEERALRDAYSTIAEIALAMDYGLMEDLLNSLKGYQLSPEDDKIINRIKDLLNALDWDGIRKEASDGLLRKGEI